MEYPSFTVITVCLNPGSKLAATVDSVETQNYASVEHVIVDGGSRDGTRNWLVANSSRFQRWVSKPDNGLYDAMNTGLSLATGDFVVFINAGDRLAGPETFVELAHLAGPETDILYGEVLLVDQDRSPLGLRSEITTQCLPDQLTWQSLSMGMAVCHQGFISRRAIAPAFVTNNLSADIDWAIKCLQRSRHTVRAPGVVAEFLTGGISQKHFARAMFDRFLILNRHFGTWNNLKNHFRIILRRLSFQSSARTHKAPLKNG